MEEVFADWRQYYEYIWTVRQSIFDEILAAESSLARTLAKFTTLEEKYSIGLSDINDATSIVYSKHENADDDAISKLERRVIGAARSALFEFSPYHTFNEGALLNDFADGVDCVIEIGSGYGKKLFQMWLNGGSEDITYIAAEPIKAGREITRKLAALEPGMRIEVVDFDFDKPDLGILKKFNKVLLFTSWSLMYAKTLNADFFDNIVSIPGEVKCVFIEPISFQITRDTQLSVIQHQNAVRHQHNLVH
ncbi:hypothetical protein MCP1_590001 [Candidatus Terasakiella magnetica]|nr:hypothetical protein MCP1_590001 [Candidatus Terasakiella magnetica]